MDTGTKKKAMQAFEGRASKEAHNHIFSQLSECIKCEFKADCKEIGNNSFCKARQLTSKQSVLDLS